MFICSLDSSWMSVVCAYNDDGPHCYMRPPLGGQQTFIEDKLHTRHSLSDDLIGVLKWFSFLQASKWKLPSRH